MAAWMLKKLPTPPSPARLKPDVSLDLFASALILSDTAPCTALLPAMTRMAATSAAAAADDVAQTVRAATVATIPTRMSTSTTTSSGCTPTVGVSLDVELPPVVDEQLDGMVAVLGALPVARLRPL